MAKLDARKRSELPDRAFAYVDSTGRRLLPINDEPHVRNALSRFGQVKFEDEAAKERAFRKLLTAASKHGIAPIGFVARQLKEAARDEGIPDFPSGPVTFLLSDIEGSTVLVHQLGDRYHKVLTEVQSVIREAVDRHRGYEVDARADEFFAAFAHASDALRAALEREYAAPVMEARVASGEGPRPSLGVPSTQGVSHTKRKMLNAER